MNDEFAGITAVLTSCRRPDLLECTLQSLARHAPGLFDRFIVIEDSDGSAVAPVMQRFPAIRFEPNGRQLGQLASIDRAYAMVETDYVFHLEDDWSFYRPGFIADSRRLLDAFRQASMVGCRRTGGDKGHDAMVLASPVTCHDGLAFRWLESGVKPEWGGYSFNPGLRRMADYRSIGPFAKYRSELEISGAFREAGRAIIQLEHSACEHIGWERHVKDPNEHVPLTKRMKKGWKAARKKLLQRA